MKHLALVATFFAAVGLGLLGSEGVGAGGEDPHVEFSPNPLEILNNSSATVTVLIQKDLTQGEIDAGEVIVELVDTSPNLGDKTLKTQKPAVPEGKEKGDEFEATLTFTLKCKDGKIVGSDSSGAIDLAIELEGGITNYGSVTAKCVEVAAVVFDPVPVEIPIGGDAEVTVYIKKRITLTEANDETMHARLVDVDAFILDPDDDLAEKTDIDHLGRAANKVVNVRVTFTLECPKDIEGHLGTSGETEVVLAIEFPPAITNHGKGEAICVEPEVSVVPSTGVQPADVVVDDEKKLVLLLNAGGPGVDVFTTAGTFVSTIDVPCADEPARLPSSQIGDGSAQPASHCLRQGMVLFRIGVGLASLAWLGILDNTIGLMYFLLLSSFLLQGDAEGAVPAYASPLGDDIISVPVGDGPVAAGYDPATGQIYVANRGSGNVTVIDAATMSVVVTIPVGGSPNGVAINSEAGRAYVSNDNGRKLTVIDTSTNEVLENIDVGAGPHGVAVDLETGRVYVANFTDGTVSVIDGGLAASAASAGPVIDTITVGAGPIDIAVNPRTDHIFVANAIDDTLSIIDRNTNQVVSTVAMGKDPDAVGVSVDAGLVFVANHGDNTMTILKDAPQPLSMLWTDVDCNFETDAFDALTLLRDLAALSITQTQPCFEIGGDVDVTQFNKTTERKWGDADCSGEVDVGDVLQNLRQVGELPMSQVEPCPPIGSIVGVLEG